MQGRPDHPQREATTADLVIAARNGSTNAFAELHRRYHRVVESVVRADTRCESDVPDLVQETFTRAWVRLGSLSDPERFRAWLLQVARHQVIDHGRMMNRRPVAEGAEIEGDGWPRLDRLVSAQPGPAELAESAELADRVRVAIDGLSRRDAVAVTLAAEFGFGPDDLADALGISSNNARVVLHRARQRLRHLVGE